MSDVDHARFADWDGAYVLGALTPTDRHAYEEHLETCSRCRAAVAELAPMPGLLAQIRPTEEELAVEVLADGPAEWSTQEEPTATDTTAEAAEAAQAGARTADGPRPMPVEPAPSEADETAAPALHGVRGVRGTRPSGRRRVLVGLLAAAAALILAIALPLTLGERGTEEVVTVSPVAAGEDPAPMRVDVDLSPRAWGTALTIRCDYPSAQSSGPDGSGGYGGYGDDGAAPPSYALVVTAADGSRSEVSSWQGVPGEVVTLEAATAVDLADITEISVVDPAGAVVLRAEVDAA